MAQFSTDYRATMLNAIRTLLNSGKCRVYSGSVPADANASLGAATLLAELTLNATFAPSTSTGTLTANAITSDSSADDTGTPTFFRLVQSDGTTTGVQGTAGVGSGELDFAASITAGSTVSISSLTLTLPA